MNDVSWQAKLLSIPKENAVNSQIITPDCNYRVTAAG